MKAWISSKFPSGEKKDFREHEEKPYSTLADSPGVYRKHGGSTSITSNPSAETRRGSADCIARLGGLSLAFAEFNTASSISNENMSFQSKKDAIDHEPSSKGSACQRDSDAALTVPSSGMTPEKFQNGSTGTVTSGLRDCGRVFPRSRHVRAKSTGELDTLINKESAVHTPDLRCRCGERELGANNNWALSNCSKCSSAAGGEGMSSHKTRSRIASPDLYIFKWKVEHLQSFDEKWIRKFRGWKQKTENDFQQWNPMAVHRHNVQASYAPSDNISYASSMTEGVGRTLKGRDLLRVRNQVLRTTGFIEDKT